MPVFSAMTRPHILYLDSGVGGLPYLDRARLLRPDWDYSYLADTAGFPYGEKTPDELRRLVPETVARALTMLQPELLVVACNTASVTVLGDLRARFALPIVGVVPAVKPAARGSTGRRIGILATSRTVADAYLDGLISEFASDCVVIRLAAGEMVRFVEEKLPRATAGEIEDALRPQTDAVLAANVDTLVLGCTHFLHLTTELSRLLGPFVRIVDSVDGVTRRVAALVGHASGSPTVADARTDDGTAREPRSDLWVTKDDAAAGIRVFAERFGLRDRGTL